MKRTLFHLSMVLAAGMLLTQSAFAQGIGINTTGADPHSSAGLDVDFNNKGLLPPRMTTAQRDAIISPAPGLTIYNTTVNCLQWWNGTVWYDGCGNNTPSAALTTLNCGGAATTGTLINGTAASGVSTAISYTGGNAGTYAAQSISSTGVVGLTATLSAGTLANGAGSLTYTISGTPTTSGTASFAITVGGQSCIFTVSVITINPILGGGYSIPGTTFQASTSLGNSIPNNAFDGSCQGGAGHWHSTQYDKLPWANPWLQINLPTARQVVKYNLWHRNLPNYEDRLKSWIFQGSNDGTNWVNLDVRTNSTPPYPGTDTFNQAVFGTYSFTNNNSYLHYRIYGTESPTANQPAHEYTVIGELQLWGF